MNQKEQWKFTESEMKPQITESSNVYMIINDDLIFTFTSLFETILIFNYKFVWDTLYYITQLHPRSSSVSVTIVKP